MSNTLSFANAIGITEAANFIPEVWSLEVLAAYKQNLVMAGLVSLINHRGRKGDVIHIPSPTRGAASSKTSGSVVTLINNTEGVTNVTINQHWEYSRVVDDMAEFQALPTLRRFYLDDAGYALADRIDTDLHSLAASWGGATGYEGSGNQGAVIGSDGTTAYTADTTGNGAAIADAGIRRVIQTLDDNDTPMRFRYLTIPPVEKRKLLGEARFTEQAFTGEAGAGNSIRNGFVGDLYGVQIYMSSNCATDTATDGSTQYRAALVFQREALVLAEQLAPRIQTQYKLETLGTLLVADTIYGTATVRGSSEADDGRGCKAIMVPA
jgi:hypothetical protein